MNALPSPQGGAPRRTGGSTELHKALAACRSAFWTVALFSLAINLLNLASPIHMLQVYDRVLTTGHMETLVLLTAMTGLALLVLGALDALRNAVMVRIGCWLNDRLGPALLANGVRARLVGDTAGAQPLRDLSQIQNFVASQGMTVFFDAPWVPFYAALIWMLHPLLGSLAIGATVILLGLSIANEFATRKSTLNATLAQVTATQQADTAIRNAEVVRAMGMLPALIERWQRLNEAASLASRQAAERGGVLVGITKFVRFFVQVAMLGTGATLVLKHELSPGGMIATSILLGRALAPVEVAMSAWRGFTGARIAYGRLVTRLKAFPTEPVRTQLPDPVGSLRVHKLTYTPNGAKEPVLREVSFAVEPGEAVAVIGPSASGKSTLCRLLVGVAAPNGGEVRIDGADMAHWDGNALGRFIGYLPQDVELFAGTVRDNIARMGQVDDKAVVEAAMLAQAHDLVLRLPQGYETQIGDGGARLSGGQRQRLGLARAVYGTPRLIVLDEPNANLDHAGEVALATAINELKQRGCAVVIVGHRPSTIAEADKILLMRDGRVDLFGPRDDVMREMQRISTRTRAGNVPATTTAAPPPAEVGVANPPQSQAAAV